MQQPGFTQIGIIGAGELGSAIGEALTKAKTQVLYYDKDPARSTTASIEDLVHSCQILLLCVPSWQVEDVAKRIHKVAHPTESRLVIAMAKGVMPGFVTMDQVLAKNLPKHYNTGLLYGPMIAEEITQDRPANGVLGVTDTSFFEPIRVQFSGAHMYIEATGDVKGLAICGVLKNIYAISLGICDGLRLGLNAKGRLTVMALAETKRLLAELGGDPRMAEGTAGLGDLLSTGFSGTSFNYRIGKSLAEGIVDPHVKSEGLVTLSELARKVKLVNYPLAHAIEQTTFHFAKPQKIIDLFRG